MSNETDSAKPAEKQAAEDLKKFKEVKEVRPPESVPVASKKETKYLFDGWLKKTDKEKRLKNTDKGFLNKDAPVINEIIMDRNGLLTMSFD